MRQDLHSNQIAKLRNFACCLFALAACAPLPPKPETRTQTVQVLVPQPVPCFREEDRPILPPPTPIDIDNATVDQLVAALAADLENERIFTTRVDAIFLQCLKSGAQP